MLVMWHKAANAASQTVTYLPARQELTTLTRLFALQSQKLLHTWLYKHLTEQYFPKQILTTKQQQQK